MASRRLLHRLERDGVPAHANLHESFVHYGTPLPALQDHRKDMHELKPEWQQEVYDDRGRRRFHGAFTGGFSAGYFNTVGSKEGWAPSSFRSSRASRAPERASRVEDFMDEEDLADHRENLQLRTTADYARADERDPFAALGTSHSSVRATTSQLGQRILQHMGWKPGQGIGPLVSAKRRAQLAETLRAYGVDVAVPDTDAPHMFPPPDTALPPLAPNLTRQGLGSRTTALDAALARHRTDEGGSTDDAMRLGEPRAAPSDLPPGFVPAAAACPPERTFAPPPVPANWTPDPRRVWADERAPPPKPQRAAERRAVLGEPAPPGPPPVVADYLSRKTRERLARAQEAGASQLTAVRVPPLDAATAQRALDAPRASADHAQDARFRDYLAAQIEGKGRMPRLAPGDIAAQQRELDEFQQAAAIFRPVSGAMASRFTASTTMHESVGEGGLHVPTRAPAERVEQAQRASEAARKQAAERAAEAQRTPAQRAARAGHFGAQTRSESRFQPPALLCKRLGVPPPRVEEEAVEAGDPGAPPSLPPGLPPGLPPHHHPSSNPLDPTPEVTFIESEIDTAERPPVDLFRAVFDVDDADDPLAQFKRRPDTPSAAPKKKSRRRTGPLTFDPAQDDDIQ